MPDIEELVKIEITKPLPEMGNVGGTYKIKGSVKMFDAIGAPPWVYAEVRRKEWWKPEIVEEVSYERGFPIPITGDFSIDIKTEKKSDYEVTVVATPAPLSLPFVGVFPITGKSDMMKIRVAEPTATDIQNIEISVIGPVFPATDLKNIAILVSRPEFPATDIKNIKIALVAVPVEYRGSIAKKELEYDGSRGTIPVHNVPQDKRGLVHIWGRNDMATSQKLGISWIVRDPDGIVVEAYSDWQTFSATPGGTHEFIGGRFDLNKTGIWTIAIALSMNPVSPVMVASYVGVLCTVAVAPAEYTLAVIIEPFGAGYVTISPKKAAYSVGEEVTLTAYPYSGSVFYNWRGWDSQPSTINPITVIMDRNKWVVAAFGR